jgi:hypothetical protein
MNVVYPSVLEYQCSDKVLVSFLYDLRIPHRCWNCLSILHRSGPTRAVPGMDMSDTVAIITGPSGGIGLAREEPNGYRHAPEHLRARKLGE